IIEDLTFKLLQTFFHTPEESAPDGYLVASDVEFEVTDTCEVQHVVMVDEAKSSIPKTGDENDWMLWLVLALLGAGAVGTSIFEKVHRRCRNRNRR
ncbi:MAG: LPXTG cell wall anchor domain-containing protein, partial [Clostridiales bacterium]|nr:LPXTG cell wall anchor domain-containing protein [Clostridiales bacterium]